MSEIFFLSGTPEEKKDKRVLITSFIINCLVWTMAIVLILHTAVEIMHHLSMAKGYDFGIFAHKPPPFVEERESPKPYDMMPFNHHNEHPMMNDRPPFFHEKRPDHRIHPNDAPPPSPEEIYLMPEPKNIKNRTLDPRHNFNSDFIRKMLPLRIFLLMCHLFVGLGTLYILNALTKGYRRREFFSKLMVRNYALLGIGLIILSLISLAQALLTFNAFNFTYMNVSKQLFVMILELWFKPYGILAITGLHCLVLAVVMREGNRMSEEQSLTI